MSTLSVKFGPVPHNNHIEMSMNILYCTSHCGRFSFLDEVFQLLVVPFKILIHPHLQKNTDIYGSKHHENHSVPFFFFLNGNRAKEAILHDQPSSGVNLFLACRLHSSRHQTNNMGHLVLQRPINQRQTRPSSLIRTKAPYLLPNERTESIFPSL